MKIIEKFITNDDKTILLVEPSFDLIDELVNFTNDLVEEDSYLTLTGRPKTTIEERSWLDLTLREIRMGRNHLVWAMDGNKIVGSCDIRRGESRDMHVGTIGIMVRKSHRRQGIGKNMFDYIIRYAKNNGYKIVKLTVFSDNLPGINLYKKFGLKEYGRLPKGFYRKGKFSDRIEMYKEIRSNEGLEEN